MLRVIEHHPFASLQEAASYRDGYVLQRFAPYGYGTRCWIEHVDNDSPAVILHVSRWSSRD